MSQSMVGITPEQQAYLRLQQSIIIQRYKSSGVMPNTETSNAFDFTVDLNEY